MKKDPQIRHRKGMPGQIWKDRKASSRRERELLLVRFSDFKGRTKFIVKDLATGKITAIARHRFINPNRCFTFVRHSNIRNFEA